MMTEGSIQKRPLSIKLTEGSDDSLRQAKDLLFKNYRALIDEADKFEIVEGASPLFGSGGRRPIDSIVLVIEMKRLNKRTSEEREAIVTAFEDATEKCEKLGAIVTYVEKM